MNNAEVWRFELQIRTKIMYTRITKKKPQSNAYILKNTQSSLESKACWSVALVGRLVGYCTASFRLDKRWFVRLIGRTVGRLVGWLVKLLCGSLVGLLWSHLVTRHVGDIVATAIGGASVVLLFLLYSICFVSLIGRFWLLLPCCSNWVCYHIYSVS